MRRTVYFSGRIEFVRECGGCRDRSISAQLERARVKLAEKLARRLERQKERERDTDNVSNE